MREQTVRTRCVKVYQVKEKCGFFFSYLLLWFFLFVCNLVLDFWAS